MSVSDFAEFLSARGDMRGALDRARAALALRRDLSKADPADREGVVSLAQSHSSLASLLAETGRRGEALENFWTARRMFESLLEKDPSNARTARLLAILYEELGGVVSRSRDEGSDLEACGLYRLSVETFRDLDQRKTLSRAVAAEYEKARQSLAGCATPKG